MNSMDSVEKIITSYFAPVTLRPFGYKNKIYHPKRLRVSPGMFTRQMICHPNCGGCCRKFTMDWLPGEKLHSGVADRVEERMIQFDGEEFPVMSDMQVGNDTYYCHHLNLVDGRCGIHDNADSVGNALSCEFELIRFTHSEIPERANQVTHRPFGRGWAMRRIDGERGARCEWFTKEPDPEWTEEVIGRFIRLKDWTDHFKLDTCIPAIVRWLETGPHTEPLWLDNAIGFEDERSNEVTEIAGLK